MISIANVDSIDRTTIGTHAICTIFFGNKDYWDGTWAQAFSYMAIVDELLYLLLDLLGFLGVDAVGCNVRKGCALGMRSIQCSMPCRGGSPGGSSSGKTSWNSCKR